VPAVDGSSCCLAGQTQHRAGGAHRETRLAALGHEQGVPWDAAPRGPRVGRPELGVGTAGSHDTSVTSSITTNFRNFATPAPSVWPFRSEGGQLGA